ncbi:MAG: hypothetical protein ACKOFW_02580, partial [Planctomycetaceae bacterium]
MLATGTDLAEGVDSLCGDWSTSGTASIVTQASGSAAWNIAASLTDGEWQATSGTALASELTLSESHQSATGSYSIGSDSSGSDFMVGYSLGTGFHSTDSTGTLPPATSTGPSNQTHTGDLLTGSESRSSSFWQTTATITPGTLLLDETHPSSAPLGPSSSSLWSSVGTGWQHTETSSWQRFVIDQGTGPQGQFTLSHYVSQSSREDRTLARSATADWYTDSGSAEALSSRGLRFDFLNDASPTSTLSLLGGLVTLEYAGSLVEEGFTYEGEGIFAEWTFDPLTQEWAEPDVGWLGESGVEQSVVQDGTWSVAVGPLTGQLDVTREFNDVEHEQSRFSELTGWRGSAGTDEFERHDTALDFHGQLTLDELQIDLDLEGTAASDWSMTTAWTLTPDQRWVQSDGSMERDQQLESSFSVATSSTRSVADGSETVHRGQFRKSRSEVWDRFEFDPTAPAEAHDTAIAGDENQEQPATEDDTAGNSADENSSTLSPGADADSASPHASSPRASTPGAWRRIEGQHARREESADWFELTTQGTYETAWDTGGTWSSTMSDHQSENWWIEQIYERESADWRTAGRSLSQHELRYRSLWDSDSDLPRPPANATGTGTDSDTVTSSATSPAITGSYSESGLVEQSLVYSGSARLTSAGWSSTLSATASSLTEAEARLDYATSWTDTTDLGPLVGTTTGFAKWSWNAETTLTAELDRSGPNGKPVWRGTVGAGSAHWLASGEATFSGTGAVSQLFDDGQGTAAGTQARQGHSQWEEEYDETREYLADEQRFDIDGQGNGTGTGITHSTVALSGQTGDSSNGTSLVVAGQAEDRWSADWEWSADGNWRSFLHEWGTRQQAGTLTKKTKAQTTAQPTAASTTGTITTSSEGKFVEVQREEGAYSIETEWQGDWAGSEWTREAESRAEGSRSAEWTGKSVVSWDTKYADGTLTRTDVGSDTVESQRTENSTWGVFTAAMTRSDGWGQGRTTREGTKDSGWSLTRTVRNDWTETRKSAPGSSWGGTGSTGYSPPSTKQSGSTSSQTQQGATSTPESWSTTVSWTTAAIAVPGDSAGTDATASTEQPILGVVDLESVFGVLRDPASSTEQVPDADADGDTEGDTEGGVEGGDEGTSNAGEPAEDSTASPEGAILSGEEPDPTAADARQQKWDRIKANLLSFHRQATGGMTLDEYGRSGRGVFSGFLGAAADMAKGAW